jgi:hypothetical protein
MERKTTSESDARCFSAISAPCDLIRLPVRSSVAVLPAAITLVQEPLVIPLQLVVQDHAIDSAALLAESLLGAQVGAIDLRVVRQLARLSEVRVERLLWLPGAVMSVMPIRLEQVTSSVCQRDGAIIGADRERANQPFLLKVFETSARCPGVLEDVVEIALGDHPKRADRRQRSGLGAVDLVHAFALPNRPALLPTWEIETLRECITRVAIVVPIAIARATAATRVAVPGVATVAIVVARIVPVPHISSRVLRRESSADTCSRASPRRAVLRV